MSSYKNSVYIVSEGVAKLNPQMTLVQFYGCLNNKQVLVRSTGAACDILVEVEQKMTLISTMRFKTDNVKVYNLNIANTASNAGQALAVNVNATNYGFYACSLTGYQDTVLTDKDLELYARTYINGAIDFVFGSYVQA
ncbi:unnamed protein product [Peronospora farinosa]|uniref:Pectinesterase n=1 Tax=Peronospora farinosa TaxID=134698 RepID=A0AAV0SXN2_9STRA|nr:unnamed protein product [Peronospora farinosa]CAI5710371.1 unnamed protein product [Peronospora farinosa]